MATERSLTELAHHICYGYAAAAIEGTFAGYPEDGSAAPFPWLNPSPSEPMLEEREYLERRGLLEHHPDNPSWIRILDESEDDQSESATEINLCPVGMVTEAGAKRVSDALEDFKMATTDAANYFQQLWDEGAIRDGLKDDEMQEAKRTLELRADAQNEFLRALAGLPPVDAKKGGR